MDTTSETLFEYAGLESSLRLERFKENNGVFYRLIEYMNDKSGEYFCEQIDEKSAIRLKTWLERIQGNR